MCSMKQDDRNTIPAVMGFLSLKKQAHLSGMHLFFFPTRIYDI